ncbi:L-ascorbate metabolism protein UlaG (beta-lactamase superfamily) [Clostridium tetanomorphum]|uniref:MBL fold metallo-hydrolase n=1 Tax=Clostridium tetanomorphum TaxID=1553 RepID=A0A923E9Y1_CLOTT|nr:MBL fold metallo-hydrolase [Clostridium tetanomorphum]KAJ49863.1 hydrolase [Clostridium tetanomorphum DSM 665]MBC2399317.1 MBL fold metallo-hydrolase [Clostridium tetanomorphum]MBP1866122.1 L-ascorbate metabolism protein UlaG (beta-lactamase superfamily) [Clostridium tetanomorphum]NRS86750.1 L-ascorbate metabolism protein UlaG (beta-lactamase superfamily) [Clostridium tetanomorphum]NRZ99497.1 L-ascorbate metabolism protein UlaG (beta-lactamase superfamily) [Clostridium tetanomorphum]
MEIKWLGHSSFLITDSSGRTVLTDPFDNSIGYNSFSGEVDVVTISHHHFDHDNVENISKNAKIVDKIGLFNVCDIPIQGIPSYHDEVKGAKRGENIIYVLQMDGYKLCHLGDLGCILSAEQVKQISNVDVLFIPIGGNYTINGKEACQITKLIKSHIIIPMHYKTPALTFPLEGLENFLKYMQSAHKVNNNYIKITGNIDDLQSDVRILDYS